MARHRTTGTTSSTARSGEIRFGDGQAGMIPPPGTRNLPSGRRSGGGTGGNLPAGAVKSLVAGIRYVGKVKLRSRRGGAAGKYRFLLERAPKALRAPRASGHRRSLEDLAKLASNEVGALRAAGRSGERTRQTSLHPGLDDEAGAGKVSVIIVPRLTDPKPLPSQTLLHRVTGLPAPACRRRRVRCRGQPLTCGSTSTSRSNSNPSVWKIRSGSGGASPRELPASADWPLRSKAGHSGAFPVRPICIGCCVTYQAFDISAH